MTVPFREASIDLDAIADNVRHFRRLTGVEVIAVVKANAYGHGAAAAAVAALSAGATRLGVAEIPEALELRRQGVHAPLMAWLHAPGERFEHAAAQDIELGISSFDQLEAAAAAATVDRPVGVHLKFETGLSRNGIAPADWGRVLAEAARLERIGRLRIVGLSATSRTPRQTTTGPRSRSSRKVSPRPHPSASTRRSATSATAARRRHRPARDATRRRAHRGRPVRPVSLRRPQFRRTRAATRHDPPRSDRRRAQSAGGHGRLVRLRPTAPTATRRWSSCRSDTPTVCRGMPRGDSPSRSPDAAS